jgi:serine/threonine protein kinase
MGVVYLAHDDHLKRMVAVKVIHPKWAADSVFRQKFVTEGHRLAAVPDNDHVVRVFAAGGRDDRPFLVMQYLEGVNLDQWLAANGNRDAATNVAWVAEHVLTGLAAVHDAGLIHRDIKPGNLWVAHGKVKLLDFGIAAHAGRETMTAGTTAYMAPQVAAGGEADAKSDLYSVGVVLYLMATGKLVGTVPDLAVEPKFQELPPVLRGFVLELLDKEPAKRPASAHAALAQLKAIRDRKPSNPWAWLTVGLSATLGLLIAGWLLVRAEQAQNVELIRATEVELERGLDELSEAVKELNAAQAIDLNGKMDAAARLKSADQFREAMKRYDSAKARIDAAHRTRANLLDLLGSKAAVRDKKE